MDAKYSLGFSLLLMILLASSLYVYFTVMDIEVIVTDPLTRITLIVLLVLLIVVAVRFFLLLWFSYLAHLEEEEPLDFDFTPGVTILLPAYNEGMVIKESIQSLLHLDYPNYEILVIDDGSTDNTYALASQYEGEYGKARVRVVTKKNTGKALSLNVGIDLAENDYLLCMDGDSKLSPETLAKAIPHFRDPYLGAVAGNVKVINRDGLWTKLQALEYIEGLNVVRRAQGFLRLVNIIPGPIGIFRKEALQDVGGYDHDTFAEDCDLTLKLISKGWRVKYEPGAISYTEAPEKLFELLKQRYRWTRGILQAMRKHSFYLFHPKRGMGNFLVLGQMVFEGLIWPFTSVAANIFFIVVALVAGYSSLIFVWWAQLTLLEMIVALHTVAMEREDLRLVPYTIFYPLFFILIINVTKSLSTLEEIFGIRMTWGKLDRIGKL